MAADEQTAIKNFHEFVVWEHDLKEYDEERRVRLASVQEHLGEAIRFGREPQRRAYYYAQPAILETGLVLPVRTPSIDHDSWIEATALDRDTDHSVVRISERPDGRILPDYTARGVAFSSDEFGVIAHSAIGLGSKIKGRTRKARQSDPDRDASKEAELRSAGHTLEGYIEGQKGLVATLWIDNQTYRALMAHIFKPGHTRKARALNADRAVFDEKLHDTIEVAGLNIPTIKTPVTKTIAGLHRVARRHMYSGNYSSAERDMFTAEYLRLMIKHNTNKIAVAQLAKKGCQRVLTDRYQAALDRDIARKEQAAQQADAAAV